MNNKLLYWLAMILGSTIGSYLPALFGASVFSMVSVLGGFVGGIAGIYAVYKLST